MITMPTVLVLGGIFVLFETFILVEYVVDLTSTLSSPNSQDSTTFKPHLIPLSKKIAAKKKKKEQAGKQAKCAAENTKKEAKLIKERKEQRK